MGLQRFQGWAAGRAGPVDRSVGVPSPARTRHHYLDGQSGIDEVGGGDLCVLLTFDEKYVLSRQVINRIIRPKVQLWMASVLISSAGSSG